jgi:tRNA (mo5U34)-methyltransferase
MNKHLDTKNQLVALAAEFDRRLKHFKSSDEEISWYPYQSMTNVEHLYSILPQTIVDRLCAGDAGWRVLDVGAADGDLGFFFESRGCDLDFLDNPPTNFNDCDGIRAMQGMLESSSKLIVQDIDRAFTLDESYQFAIALGLLYHLRNPMAFLMTLAERAERMVLSTRVANHLPDGTDVSRASLSYFLRCREANNDPTNYWVFTPLGLETLLRRCGWRVVASKLLGPTVSNPVDEDADQRMFVYCERVENWRDLCKHHDF